MYLTRVSSTLSSSHCSRHHPSAYSLYPCSHLLKRNAGAEGAWGGTKHYIRGWWHANPRRHCHHLHHFWHHPPFSCLSHHPHNKQHPWVSLQRTHHERCSHRFRDKCWYKLSSPELANYFNFEGCLFFFLSRVLIFYFRDNFSSVILTRCTTPNVSFP